MSTINKNKYINDRLLTFRWIVNSSLSTNIFHISVNNNSKKHELHIIPVYLRGQI